MAVDQAEMKDVLEGFGGWESMSTSTKLEDAEPFLGVVVVDELQPSKSEFAKGPYEWHFYVRPVRFKLDNETNAFRDICQHSTKERSKIGAILTGLRSVFGRNVHIAAAQTTGAEKSELIGRVAWFKRATLKFGADIEIPATVAFKKASSEEEFEAQEVGLYVNREGETAAAPVGPSFDWTDENVKMAMGVLVGQNEKTKLRAARDLPTEAGALRNAVNSGEAERYLQENGYLVMDEDSNTYRAV